MSHPKLLLPLTDKSCHTIGNIVSTYNRSNISGGGNKWCDIVLFETKAYFQGTVELVHRLLVENVDRTPNFRRFRKKPFISI